jgi:hypothetical protein
VPVQKSETYSVCVSDNVCETKTESYVVRVPKKVTKKVCTTVNRCVEEQVPAGDAGDACGNGSNGSNGGCGKAHKGLLGCKKGC